MVSEQVTPFSKNRVKSLGFFLILYGVVKKKIYEGKSLKSGVVGVTCVPNLLKRLSQTCPTCPIFAL